MRIVPAALLCAAITHASDYRFSGPYTHQNLSIYLIHSSAKAPGKNYVTLAEAMDQKKVVVHETGNVNELAVENRSGDDVYIQGGDIVKGGQQDRVISNDFILPGKSGRVPIASFCVEQGRWRQRGNEAAGHFETSTGLAASKEVKFSMANAWGQASVWDKVTVFQRKLGQSLGLGQSASLQSRASPSSFALTLEDPRLDASAEGYLKALSAATSLKPDAVGYAFVINGEINSADVYASPRLFARLWPRLLRASAIEAISQYSSDRKHLAPAVQTVKAALTQAETGKETARDASPAVKLIKRESPKTLFLETHDSSAWVHRSYLFR